jgi:RNA-binding protein Luc7-like 2
LYLPDGLSVYYQKMDMGPCPKLHSEAIAKKFQEAKAQNPSDPRFAAFEQEYQNNIYAFVDDCDRKIRMSQKRLEKTPEENRRTVDLVSQLSIFERKLLFRILLSGPSVDERSR